MNTAITLTEEMEGYLNRFLTFDLGSERYGITINQVTEIIGLQEINKLPEMTNDILGIINLRGKIVPVIDMGMKFEKIKKEYSNMHHCGRDKPADRRACC